MKEFRSATKTICASSIINRHISYLYYNQWSCHTQWLHKIIPWCYSAIRGWWTIRRTLNYDPSCEYCAGAAQCRKTLTFSPSGSKNQFFLDGADISLNSVNSADSGNLIISWNMNWVQFKDPVSQMCLAGTVVASWSLTQEVTGSSLFTVMANILPLNSVKTFRNKNAFQ